MFEFKKYSLGCWQVTAPNGVPCGELICKEDWFYDWWPPMPSRGGFWSQTDLKQIADKLFELNAPYQAELDAYFSKQELDEKVES